LQPWIELKGAIEGFAFVLLGAIICKELLEVGNICMFLLCEVVVQISFDSSLGDFCVDLSLSFYEAYCASACWKSSFLIWFSFNSELHQLVIGSQALDTRRNGIVPIFWLF
jgi:hypothetical protein